MPCERIDYYSEEEFQEALRDEERAWSHEDQHEPDIVPCFKCGCQMYWECSEPEGNICSKCKPPPNPGVY